MKTCAAKLLDALCIYIDGTLSQIFYFSSNVLEDFLNTQYSKNLLLIVICILRPQTKQRSDLHIKLSAVICKLLKDLELPKKSTQQPQNIFFSLVLLALIHYFAFIEKVNETILQKTFTLAQQLIQYPNIQQVPKLLTYDLIICSLHFQQSSIYSLRFLFVFNKILQNPKNINYQFLLCLSYLFKFNDFQFKNNLLVVLDTVEKLINLLIVQYKKNNEGNLAKTTAAWNVLQQIVDSMMIIPKPSIIKIPNQIQQSQILFNIQKAMIPIFSIINGNNHLQYQQKIFKIISICIKKRKSITQIQTKLFQLIPKLFYSQNSQISFFNNAFEILQLLIFYGSQFLMNNPQYIRNLILMCNDSIDGNLVIQNKRTQADNCEGILTLQSLIILCGACFDSEMWGIITNTITKRLHNPPVQYDFLRTNIITNLSLILMYAHKFFNMQSCDAIISQILKQYSCFSYSKCSKIFIITLCQFINLISLDFIKNRFIQILDCLITLLQISQIKKDQIFANSQLNSQQIQYSKLSKFVLNTINSINQFEYFRTQIKKFKQAYPQKYQEVYKSLPQIKKQYFKDILSSVKIGNQARKILKIKK